MKTLIPHRWLPAVAAIVILSAAPARAVIPPAAINDPRYALGYLVVTHYGMNLNNGSTDATSGIQQAINDAKANRLAVFFPAGTYIVSNTLYCANWQLWVGSGPTNPTNDRPPLVGSRLVAARPVIKLAANATGFGNPADIKPIIAFRNWRAVNSDATNPALPGNAFDDPPNFDGIAPNSFDWELRDIDFDCNGNAGAVGISFPGAQNATVENVRVNATGAYAGIFDLPGLGGSGNIEVQGGKYGLINKSYSDAPGSQPLNGGGNGSNGLPVAGLRLLDQEVAAIESASSSGNFCAVGFYIRTSATGSAILISSSSVTAAGPLCLIDGTIEMPAGSIGVALPNAAGKSVYFRNVYVTNTNNVVQSGSEPAVVRSGTWKRIVEYAYTDQANPAGDPPPYEQADEIIRTFSIINGNVSQSPAQPVVNIVSNVSAPPADLISRHLWASLPSFEDGATGGNTIGIFENVAQHGATAETTSNAIDDPSDVATGAADLAAFQTAITAAATAGHNRVFVPRGAFHLNGTLTLGAHTKLFGVGRRVSTIGVHSSWGPTTGSPFMIDTVNDTTGTATTFFGMVNLVTRTQGGGPSSTLIGPNGVGADNFDRFSHVRWRAGRNSMTIGIGYQTEWHDPCEEVFPRVCLTFEGGGGGRHYFFVGANGGIVTASPAWRNIKISGTTEPLWIYGCNVEATKGSGSTQGCPGGYSKSTANIEMINAQNVRLIGFKREGFSPTLVVNNSSNVALFGHEMRSRLEPSSLGAIFQVLGTSNNVVIAVANARSVENLPVTGDYLLSEAITGQLALNFNWPESLSIYKRGDLDDAAAYIPGPGAVGGPNLVQNPSFETTLGTEWTADSFGATALTRQSGNAHSGTFALRAVAGAGSYGERSQSGIPVTAGQLYTISGYIRVDSVSGGGFTFKYGWYNSSGTLIGATVDMDQNTVTSGYVLKVATVTAPAGAVTLRFRCAIKSGTNSGTAYFDNLSVAAGSGSPEVDVTGNGIAIVDGDTTPNASDHTDFGSTDLTTGTVQRTFTILNTGNAALTVSTLTAGDDFGVLTAPPPSIAAGSTGSFTIAFIPTAVGLRTATVSFGNSDADENPYNFSIQGTGTPSTTTVTFTSVGAEDGWVLESGENADAGGSVNATASDTSALRAGDDAAKKQYKSIVSFNTSSLPDTATILSATLKLKRGTQSGVVTTLGTLYADIKSYNFNSNSSLETADFAAATPTPQVATMSLPTSNGQLSTGTLNSSGLNAVNKVGNTQFRIYFLTDDDNDSAADYIGFYSGENATTANRPILEVVYQ